MTALDVMVRVSIVLALAWTLSRLLSRQPAALRHWLLAAGIIGAAIAPAVPTFTPTWHLPQRTAPVSATPQPHSAAAPSTAQPAIAITLSRPTPVVQPPVRRMSIASLAVWAWALGAFVAFFVLAVGLARLVWIASHAEPLSDPTWDAIHDELARSYGLRKRATLLQIDQPLLVTWGSRRPKIVVPRGAAAWPRERIRIVLAHELAHIARGDWVLQLAAECVRAAHWCNPLAWIVCRRARLESEHACDDFVLNLGVTGSEYASHLLDLARSMHTRRHAWVPAQAIVRPSSLERRVAAMLNARLNHAPLSRSGRIAAVLVVGLVTVFASGFSAAQNTTVLSGTIADQLGGSIKNTTVSLRDLTTNATYEVQTDATGHYAFAALPSDDYLMTIKALGFQPIEQRVVLTGAALERNMQLRLGTVQESITVIDGPSTPAPPIKQEILAKLRAKANEPSSCSDAGGCIAPPSKVTDKKPVFPDSQIGIGGIVTLKCIIDATGHVSNIQPVGTANADLVQAAIAAVSQWEFIPTRLDGQVVDTEMTVTVNFKTTK